jgi:hypothetical protein
MDIFDYHAQKASEASMPLAERMLRVAHSARHRGR